MNGFCFADALRRTALVLSTAVIAVTAQQTAFAQGKTKSTATRTVKASTALTRATYSYFPSSSTTDGRFVSIAGSNLESMAGDKLEFGIGLPATTDSLHIGIFDGDTGGLWDLGTTPLTYTLYADSTADGTGTVQVASWSGSTMADNAWHNITLAKSAAARSTDTIYFYRLVVHLSDTTTKTWSNFKLRTNGTAALLPRAFAFAAPLFTTNEARIIYPNYPGTGNSTYDGTWTFYLTVPEAVEELEVWDGDMDFGSYDGTKKDTDDADTPNQLPAWCTSAAARAEGVATSNDFIVVNGNRSTTTRMTGAPADDNLNTWYRRSPSVEYSITDPDGRTYTNTNPSGNREWERFRISTILTSASDYDHYTSLLPRGTYRMDLRGMDLGNLNAWRVFASLIGSSDTVVLSNGNRDTYGPSTSNFRFLPAFGSVDSAGTPIRMLVPTESVNGGTKPWGWWFAQESRWIVKVITAGGVSYSRGQAIGLRNAGNDLCTRIARELIAAKLNIMGGTSSTCIHDVIIDADAWLAANPIGTTNPNTTTGNPIHRALQRYNTGQSDCAGGSSDLD